MGKIYYIIGKSSSGKDTIFKKLKEKLDVNTYVMYTTRPIRNGETDGVTYHYITNQEMNKYIEGKKEEKLIEYRTYQTIHGPWTYATIADNQFKSEKNMLMLGTLESYQKMKEIFKGNIVAIYIEDEDGLRLERALERERQQKEPKYEERCRRFLADSKDFAEENLKKAGITKRFENIELEKCFNEILEEIKSKI